MNLKACLANIVAALSWTVIISIWVGFGVASYATITTPKESDYQTEWCKGQIEVRLPDQTRVDCLTDEYAIEIDFANKWKQAIGQSLHYALVTGKKPAIALIVRQPSDQKYVEQLKAVLAANELEITVYAIEG